MNECYDVIYGNRQAGKVLLKRKGLYVHVICRCQISGDQVYRLFAESPSGRENLGVVVPDGDGFLLDRKIPAKRLGTGPLRFGLSAADAGKHGKFIPIYPEEPFQYIDRLKDAFLQTEHGRIGIKIAEHPEAG